MLTYSATQLVLTDMLKHNIKPVSAFRAETGFVCMRSHAVMREGHA